MRVIATSNFSSNADESIACSQRGGAALPNAKSEASQRQHATPRKHSFLTGGCAVARAPCREATPSRPRGAALQASSTASWLTARRRSCSTTA